MPVKVWTHYSWIFSSTACVNQPITFAFSETTLMSTSWGSSCTVVAISKYYISPPLPASQCWGKTPGVSPHLGCPRLRSDATCSAASASVFSSLVGSVTLPILSLQRARLLDAPHEPATAALADSGFGWHELLKASVSQSWGRSVLDRLSLSASTLLLDACCFCTELKRKKPAPPTKKHRLWK